jgi:uncharacterized membrane protein YedE/YeeE
MLQTVLTGLACGAALGFVLQRGRFCLTGGFRDMYIARDNRIFYALLVAIAIQSVGVYTLVETGALTVPAKGFAWLATIVGSFVFGIGILLGGGCATGTWYRAGEGLVGSWIALAGYMLLSAVMKAGPLAPLSTAIRSVEAPNNSIAATLHVPVWALIGLFAALVGWIVYREVRRPKAAIPSLPARRRGLAHVLFERRWHPFATAAIVGVIAVLAWPLSAATGRLAGLGITTPSANILQYLVTGQGELLDWGVFLVLGIGLGSFIAAKASHEFRFRVPDAKTSVVSFAGGVLMGFGAALAGGCTIGNSLVQTALMTWQGWTALVFTILGTWTAAHFVFVRPARQAARGAVRGSVGGAAGAAVGSAEPSGAKLSRLGTN